MSTKKTQEIECKFLDIDIASLTDKLEQIGKLKYKRLFRRYVFDFPDLRLNADNSWLRVRDEGDQVTVSFKKRLGVKAGSSDQGMEEIEVTVNDFDKTSMLFRAIGMAPKFYEENRRTLYKVDGAEVAIDEWPLIPPYVEIEAKNWDKVSEVARKLGFDPSQKLICSTMQIYERHGINEHDYKILTFEKQERKGQP